MGMELNLILIARLLLIPRVKKKKKSPILGTGWEGSLASWFQHWCILEPQPWDTFQLGQEGA